VAPTHEQAQAEADAFLISRGIDVASMSAEDAQQFRALVTIGDPDEIGEIFAARLIDGVDGFTVNATANGHIEGRVALLGEVLANVIGASPR
jgi:hypothetical protein